MSGPQASVLDAELAQLDDLGLLIKDGAGDAGRCAGGAAGTPAPCTTHSLSTASAVPEMGRVHCERYAD